MPESVVSSSRDCWLLSLISLPANRSFRPTASTRWARLACSTSQTSTRCRGLPPRGFNCSPWHGSAPAGWPPPHFLRGPISSGPWPFLNENGPYPTVLYLHTSVHEDSDITANVARNIVIGRIQAGYVPSSMRRSGFWKVVKPLLGASAGAIRLDLTDELVSAFVVFGAPEDC